MIFKKVNTNSLSEVEAFKSILNDHGCSTIKILYSSSFFFNIGIP